MNVKNTPSIPAGSPGGAPSVAAATKVRRTSQVREVVENSLGLVVVLILLIALFSFQTAHFFSATTFPNSWAHPGLCSERGGKTTPHLLPIWTWQQRSCKSQPVYACLEHVSKDFKRQSYMLCSLRHARRESRLLPQAKNSSEIPNYSSTTSLSLNLNPDNPQRSLALEANSFPFPFDFLGIIDSMLHANSSGRDSAQDRAQLMT